MSDASPVRPQPRRGNVLLIVSLCLNVALVAMIAIGIANAIRLRSVPPPPKGGPLAPQALLAEVGPDKRTKIQSIIDAHAARLRELRVESVEARMAAFRIFEEPSFSASDFAGALDRVRATDMAVQEEAAKMTAESVAQLSPDERRAIAAKIRARTRPQWRLFMPRRMGQ